MARRPSAGGDSFGGWPLLTPMAKKKQSGYPVPIIGVSDVPVVGAQVTDTKLIDLPTVIDAPWEYPTQTEAKHNLRIPVTVTHAFAGNLAKTIIYEFSGVDLPADRDYLLTEWAISFSIGGGDSYATLLAPIYPYQPGVVPAYQFQKSIMLLNEGAFTIAGTSRVVIRPGMRLRCAVDSNCTTGSFAAYVTLTLQPFR